MQIKIVIVDYMHRNSDDAMVDKHKPKKQISHLLFGTKS
jgi:hypothetical protein